MRVDPSHLPHACAAGNRAYLEAQVLPSLRQGLRALAKQLQDDKMQVRAPHTRRKLAPACRDALALCRNWRRHAPHGRGHPRTASRVPYYEAW